MAVEKQFLKYLFEPSYWMHCNRHLQGEGLTSQVALEMATFPMWIMAKVHVLTNVPIVCTVTHTHTHAHTCLTALFLGLHRWAGTRKVKPIWILLKQDSEWQWHQPSRMQVCTSRPTCHASTSTLSFFTGRIPFLPPNQQHQSTEGMFVQ